MKSVPRILFSLTGIAFAASLVIAACSSDNDPAKNASTSTSTGGSSSQDGGVPDDAGDAGDQ